MWLLSPVVTLTGVVVAAETIPGGTIPIALVSAAISGLGVVFSGKIVVPTFAFNREVARGDKAEARAERAEAMNIEFVQELANRHVPALEHATAAVVRSTEMIDRLANRGHG